MSALMMFVRSDRLLAVLAGLVTVAVLSTVAFTGWIPQDEGTLGQAAVRVLRGEMPHVDFKDAYPGLQAVFHAGFFALLEPSIRTLRMAWLMVAGVAAAAFFLLVRRWAAKSISILVGIGAVVAGFVFYPASMPAWWNVMFAALSLVLVMKGSEEDSARYMTAAGLVSGLNVLIRTTGLYVVIPSFLWLFARRPSRNRWSLEIASIVALISISVLNFSGASLSRLILIWLPASASIVWIWMGRVPAEPNPSIRDTGRFLPWIYLGMACVPALIVVTVYAGLGELAGLVEGWVVSPSLRLGVGAVDVPIFLPSLILLGGLVAAEKLFGRMFGSRVYSVVLALAIGLWGFAGWPTFRTSVIAVSLWLPAVLISFGLYRSIRGQTNDETALFGSVAAMFAMVQIPFWSGVYTAYVIPLLVVGAVYIFRHQVSVIAIAVGCVSVVLLAQSSAHRMVGSFVAAEPIPVVVLESPRGGIRIPEAHAYYNQLYVRVREVSADSGIYAGPDAPEVAYLAGVSSANENSWEALDPNWEPSMVVDLAERGVPVAINLEPGFSPRLPESDLRKIYDFLPHFERFGAFELRWRE